MEYHLIIAHEVTNSGSDRAQLANMGRQVKAALGVDKLEAVADRGYYNSPEILACHEAGIAVTLPKPMTSGAKADGRFGKQDFVYIAAEDVYRCPAGERLIHRFTPVEHGLSLRRYWTSTCGACAIKHSCTPAPWRRVTRWEHEHILEAVQQRLDSNPQAMRQRRETVEHPLRHPEDAHGRDALPDEAPAEGRGRNGAARARLQFYARDEHHRRKAAHCSDECVRIAPVRAPGDSPARSLSDAPDEPEDGRSLS